MHKFKSLTACGLKLFVSLLDLALMLLYHFPDGSNIKSPWLGWLGFLMIFPVFSMLLWVYQTCIDSSSDIVMYCVALMTLQCFSVLRGAGAGLQSLPMTQYGLSISSPDVDSENLEAVDSLHRCPMYNIDRTVCSLCPPHLLGLADTQIEVLFLQHDVRSLTSSQ